MIEYRETADGPTLILSNIPWGRGGSGSCTRRGAPAAWRGAPGSRGTRPSWPRTALGRPGCRLLAGERSAWRDSGLH